MHDFATDRESDRDKYHHPGLGHAQRGTRKQQLTGIFGDGHKRREQKIHAGRLVRPFDGIFGRPSGASHKCEFATKAAG